MACLPYRVACLCLAGAALTVALTEAPRAAASDAQVGPDINSVKAGLLFNFVKFTEWPALPVDARIVLCIVGNDRIANALTETIRDQKISEHALEVWQPENTAAWRTCHVLFVGDDQLRRSADGLGALRVLQVLTVSDGRDFAKTGGMIELFVQTGRMRFAINVDAVERSRLHLSAALLRLATIVRDSDAQ